MHGHVLHGTADPLATLETCWGRVMGECRVRHTTEGSRVFLDTIDRIVSDDLEAHVTPDDAATRWSPPIHRWLARWPCCGPLVTTISMLRSNMAEGFFAMPFRQQFRSVSRHPGLKAGNRRCIDPINTDHKPFAWAKTVDDILDGITRSRQRASNPGHQAPFT